MNTSDWTRLEDDLSVLHGTDSWAHVDVMDGQFCPALAGGAFMIKAVADCGHLVDAHLMIEEPRRFLPEIVAAGPHVVTIHAESTRHLHRTLTELTELSVDRPGLIRGVALSPGTPVQVLDPVLEVLDLVVVLAVTPGWRGQVPAENSRRRIAQVRSLAAASAKSLLVEIDGGVTLENAVQVGAWGADVVVSGSAIFDGHATRQNLAYVLDALRTTADGHEPIATEANATVTGGSA